MFFSIIPTNIYGPYDNFCPHDSHVVPGLIQRAYKAVANATKQSSDGYTVEVDLTVCGSGTPLRQFIYAPDVARLILWCMTSFDDAPVARYSNLQEEPSIIFCPDELHGEVSIGQVAEMTARHFSKIFGVNMRVRYNLAGNSDGQYKKTASNGKLRKLLPSFEFTQLDRGLEQTIDWFCSHFPDQVRGVLEGPSRR